MSRRAGLGLIIGLKRHYYNEGDKNYVKGYWDAKRAGLGENEVIIC